MQKYLASLLVAFGLFFLPYSKATTPGILVLTIDDVIINPVVTEYLLWGIDKAEKEKYAAVLIELDTPGGLLESTRTIVKRMMSAEIPIIVYVAPSGARAASAGVFITLASHVAAMAPSSNIGAAHPVSIGGGGLSFESIKNKLKKGEEEKETGDAVMGEKIMNDTVAWVTGLASARGRNVDWAVRSVTESISSTAEEALKAGVVEYIADSPEDLLTQMEGRTVELPSGQRTLSLAGLSLDRAPLSLRQKILSVLVNPNIAYILMMLGFYGLLFEITHPGTGFPGVAGAVCLILALYAFHTLPTNYAGLALILLSLVLFIAEIKVTSYGLLSVGGVVCLVLGSLLLIDSPAGFMKVSLGVILPVVLSTVLIFLFLGTLAVRSQTSKVKGGLEGMLGRVALADTVIALDGKVFIDGEIWDARSESGQTIQKGEKVIIAKAEGMKLTVRPAS